MNRQLNKYVRNLSPSATFEMARKSAELVAQGIDVINLSVGEPDFETPFHIKEAAKLAIENNFTKYSPVQGFTAVKEAASHKLLVENGLQYSSSEILVSTGAKQSICNAIMALVGEGSEVIIPAPYWVSYPQMVQLAGGVPVFIDASFDRDFKITPEQLRSAITHKTRMIILCSPCNPTGAVYSKDELSALAEVILSYDSVVVLSDEIYEHINYVGKHVSIATLPGMKDRTIVINGVSKAYAMTGWRIGFMAAPQWIVSACNMIQGQYTSGTCSVSQKAAEAAWMGPQECVENMRRAFQRRRDLLVSLVKEIPGLQINKPQGAFYLLPRCASYFGKSDGSQVISSSSDLAMYLLEEAHVATVSGEPFGAPEFFRLSYAVSENRIVEAIRRMKIAFSKLV